MAHRPTASMPGDLEAIIDDLRTLSLDDLRLEWGRRLGRPAPACRSREILAGLIAWELQEQVHGGLTADTRRRLTRLAGTFERNPDHRPAPTLSLSPGTVLSREWRGVHHQVRVLEDGFEHQGERFTSLSPIARRITGTAWSGPKFFGLRLDRGKDRPA
ncbi:DUF2924 domain-containing protein [Azospirillum argentinense]|nr:DUF2924 domain-containing protein [Azospirillum argentinense]